ncbi:MAG: MbnP family copper-binding protein [Myxococcota bacterium]
MRLTSCALALSFGLVACGDDSADDPPTPDAGVATSFSIPFSATVGGQPISCSQPSMISGRSVEVRDFRMFVSNVEIVAADGTRVPLTLEQDGQWQDGEVALMDFEDGTGGCSESGNAATHTTLVGTASVESPTGIRFEIGVPFARNHFDTATQPPPLSTGSMFWNWRGGYKFIRIDLRDGMNPFNVHLGSTACDASTAVESPTRCDRPNRPTVVLSNVDFDRGIQLDLAQLLTGSDTSTNTADTPPGCMSSPLEPEDCSPVFGSLGLDFATGQCTTGDCMSQTFIQAMP